MRLFALPLKLLLAPLCLAQSDVSLYSMQSDGMAATSADWFYRNADASARPSGGGQFPKLEWFFSRAVNTTTVVVLRTKGSVTIGYTFYNPSGDDVPAHFAVGVPRFVRTSSSAPDVTLAATPMHKTFTIPGTGTYTVNVTYSGLPTTVGADLIQPSAYLTWGDDYGNTLPVPGSRSTKWTPLRRAG